MGCRLLGDRQYYIFVWCAGNREKTGSSNVSCSRFHPRNRGLISPRFTCWNVRHGSRNVRAGESRDVLPFACNRRVYRSTGVGNPCSFGPAPDRFIPLLQDGNSFRAGDERGAVPGMRPDPAPRVRVFKQELARVSDEHTDQLEGQGSASVLPNAVIVQDGNVRGQPHPGHCAQDAGPGGIGNSTLRKPACPGSRSHLPRESEPNRLMWISKGMCW